ncbi:MAG TPA: hypothetical protein PLD47_16065 [Aggregatilineales bacterium]|nr:hypothetical protein [Anaerolineales bacterium]HRE49244.1 hypothetical protein [Aggregatilineales bacterium]
MNAEAAVFAEWLRRRGHRVLQTDSAWWYDAAPRAYLAFPYHEPITPSAAEQRTLFREEGALALRYTAPAAAGGGVLTHHRVAHAPYDLATLSDKAQKHTRRALALSIVQPLDWATHAETGRRLAAETAARQGRRGLNQTVWERLNQAAADLPTFEAWGAFVKGELAASLVACQMGDHCLILYQQSRTDLLPQMPNNALTFAFTREVLGRAGVRAVHYGLAGLDAPPSLDDFKRRMGFDALPVREVIMFHPVLAPFANRLSLAGIRLLRRVFPHLDALGKVEGMARGAIQGRLRD